MTDKVKKETGKDRLDEIPREIMLALYDIKNFRAQYLAIFHAMSIGYLLALAAKAPDYDQLETVKHFEHNLHRIIDFSEKIPDEILDF